MNNVPMASLGSATAWLPLRRSGAYDMHVSEDATITANLASAQHVQTLFGLVLDRIGEGVAVVSADSIVLYANHALADIFGVPRTEWIGRHAEEFIPDSRLNLLAADERKRSVLLDTPRGELAVLISTSELAGSQPGDRCVFVTHDNDSQRRVLEQRVATLTEQLTSANGELESFLYSVSHDLRAPLRSILASSMMLIEDHGEKLDADAHDHLDRLAKAAKRIASLVDDLLKMSRLSRQELRRGPFDLSTEAVAVAVDLAKRVEAHGLDVTAEPDLLVNGDPALLRAFLEHLIGNSVKFTKHRPDAKVHIGAISRGDQVEFFVRDNGIGFDQQYADRIFKPFERLNAEREYPGTGIGLALAQKIIVRHGGRIWAQGVSGEGATFSFTLPESSAT